MILPIMLGAAGGLGLWLVVAGLRPRAPQLSTLTARLESPNYQGRRAGPQGDASPVGEVVERLVGQLGSGGLGTSTEEDLAMLGRTSADFARSQLQNALLLTVLPITAWFVIGVTFRSWLSPVFVALAALGAAAVGWSITRRITGQQADAARREFASGLVSYLQLVAVLLAGGAGTNEALTRAAGFGHGRCFDEIRLALAEANVRNVSPWTVFEQVAAAQRIGELDEVAAAVELAGSSGAKVRDSLMTKSASLRHTEQMRTLAAAGEASESMGVPVGIMMLGFVVLIGYPAIAILFAI